MLSLESNVKERFENKIGKVASMPRFLNVRSLLTRGVVSMSAMDSKLSEADAMRSAEEF